MTTDVSKIHLLEVATDLGVEGELRGAIEQAQIDDWSSKWEPALRDLLKELILRDAPRSQWPQSAHWNWAKKTARVKGLLAYRGFSVVAQGVTQGLAQIDLNRSAREPSQKGKSLVYVDYLEVAPWNRNVLGRPPRLKGVGSALLFAAIAASVEEGFKGRIGLHSLPQADDFYRGFGMTDLGPDPDYQTLRYFEITGEQAHAILEGE